MIEKKQCYLSWSNAATAAVLHGNGNLNPLKTISVLIRCTSQNTFWDVAVCCFLCSCCSCCFCPAKQWGPPWLQAAHFSSFVTGARNAWCMSESTAFCQYKMAEWKKMKCEHTGNISWYPGNSCRQGHICQLLTLWIAFPPTTQTQEQTGWPCVGFK